MNPTDPKSPQTATQYRRGYLRLRSALHDRVTDLPVLAGLVDRLRTELDSRSRLGLIRVEVANLDVVESLYGWQVFDRVRRRLAERLRDPGAVGLPTNRLLCLDRMAGERFLLVLLEQDNGREVDPTDLRTWTDAVESSLAGLLTEPALVGLNPALELRCGHATISPDPFYRFERRVYASVEDAGRSTERRRLRSESGWSDELHRIIRESLVSSVFQPVLDLASRRTIGHEALVRGPRDSLFEMPGSMFRLSRRLGVESQLDEVCRRVALRESCEIEGEGRLFLNVLPSCLADGAARLRASLDAEPAVVHERLVIEVSERDPEARPESWRQGVDALRERGIGLALDDVGTGPDSRRYLAALEPDYVKLDGSLVRDVDRTPIRREVLKTLIGLAVERGACVIAEGVESESEATVVHDAGAQYGQGFLFAVPSPVSSSLWDGPASTGH